MNRFRDWLDQARGNLGHAGRGLDMGDHTWACFAAHQAEVAAARQVVEFCERAGVEACWGGRRETWS